MNPSSSGKKRNHAATDENSAAGESRELPPVKLSLNSSSATPFRNVSACNRCRARKNRCDQNLPTCVGCEKAGVSCKSYDPILRREVPRTYLYYLESRVSYLEELLTDHQVPFGPPEQFELGAKPIKDHPNGSQSLIEPTSTSIDVVPSRDETSEIRPSGRKQKQLKREQNGADQPCEPVLAGGTVSTYEISDPRALGSVNNLSFERVVFAAIKRSVSHGLSEKGKTRPSKPGSRSSTTADTSSMRDSFFGLHTKPTINQAPFPDRILGERLVNLYFEFANPQIPILHRGEFMKLFDRVYVTKDQLRSPQELYMLNIVFATGAGIILEDPSADLGNTRAASKSSSNYDLVSESLKKQRLGHQRPPEEYHSSAMLHIESCLSSPDPNQGFVGLEQLQAVLLLASFALLRPVSPGLWYITGVAVRLGVDLGLHFEDRSRLEENSEIAKLPVDNDTPLASTASQKKSADSISIEEKGRREWILDLRRRLWWCVYSLDRLVSTCVGRPFGITDLGITTEFPSILDDSHITTSGFRIAAHSFGGPSYKRVAHHYFRLRLLQSEMLQVLQHVHAQKAHPLDRTGNNQYMHNRLPSPFLQAFDSFYSWRKDFDRRLWDWKESAPQQEETDVKFSVEFFELNYWQAVIVLYRQCISVPPPLADEINPSKDMMDSMSTTLTCYEDKDEIYLKVAEAGQRVLKLYRQLHRLHLVNYTYLATMHLFMAGIAFLYAVWHSTTVRSRMSLEDVDLTVLAATSVLRDLIEACPPAEACRDAFERMSKTTIQTCLTSTGFGSRAAAFNANARRDELHRASPAPQQYDTSDFSPQQHVGGTSPPPPEFDTNLRELFSEETQHNLPLSSSVDYWQPLQENQASLMPSEPISDFNTRGQSIPNISNINHANQDHVLMQQPSTILEPFTASADLTGQHQAHTPLASAQTYRKEYDVYGVPTLLASDTVISDLEPKMPVPAYQDDWRMDFDFDGRDHFRNGAQLNFFDGFFFGSAT